jgi:futalosine hydrolase
VKAITVNKVHGNENSISKIVAQFNPEIESMEGAAFFYACEQTKTCCMQIRAISNIVEKRNREKWQIGLAIKKLNDTLIQIFES